MTHFTFIRNYQRDFLIPIFRQFTTQALCDLCVLCGSIDFFERHLRVVKYSTISKNSDGASVLARFSGMLLCLVSAI
jgi:hypothetical protein